jgi:hypothetical protein
MLVGSDAGDISISHGMRAFLELSLPVGSMSHILDATFSCTAPLTDRSASKRRTAFSCDLNAIFKLAVVHTAGRIWMTVMTGIGVLEAIASFMADYINNEDSEANTFDLLRKLFTVIVTSFLTEGLDGPLHAVMSLFLPSTGSLATWMIGAFEGITGGLFPSVTDQDYILLQLAVKKIFLEKSDGSSPSVFAAIRKKGISVLHVCEIAPTFGWFNMVAITTATPTGVIPVGESMVTKQKSLTLYMVDQFSSDCDGLVSGKRSIKNHGRKDINFDRSEGKMDISSSSEQGP